MQQVSLGASWPSPGTGIPQRLVPGADGPGWGNHQQHLPQQSSLCHGLTGAQGPRRSPRPTAQLQLLPHGLYVEPETSTQLRFTSALRRTFREGLSYLVSNPASPSCLRLGGSRGGPSLCPQQSRCEPPPQHPHRDRPRRAAALPQPRTKPQTNFILGLERACPLLIKVAGLISTCWGFLGRSVPEGTGG